VHKELKEPKGRQVHKEVLQEPKVLKEFKVL
jgi:hypothetical protein